MMARIKWFFMSLFIFFLLAVYYYVKPYYLFLSQTLRISPFKTLLSWEKVNTVNDRLGFLLLGIAGGTHDGPNLSDSIIVADYNLATNELTTIGIPRDIWSNTLVDKINSAYAYGEAKQKSGGLKLAKAEAAAIVGLPIQYGAAINFDKFKELIDYLGGVDITVERSFTDNEFPIAGKEDDSCGNDPEYKCRYESLSFTQGPMHMDGTTALKFVRSRHAEGAEGSDFARSRRQQLVISALRLKIIQLLQSHRLDKISSLYYFLNAAIERDITNQQLAIIAKHVVFNDKFTQYNFALDHDLYEVPDTSVYGKYVLIPRDNDASAVHQYVHCLLREHTAKTCTPVK